MSEAAAKEIRELHEFFVAWFSGAAPKNDEHFAQNLRSRFHPELLLVQPGGQAVSGSALTEGLYRSHGGSPDFRIEIRNIDTRIESAAHTLVLYEEWQMNANNSKPANNGRLSSVVFKPQSSAPNGLLWYHVHETWLPEQVLLAGPYDF